MDIQVNDSMPRNRVTCTKGMQGQRDGEQLSHFYRRCAPWKEGKIRKDKRTSNINSHINSADG